LERPPPEFAHAVPSSQLTDMGLDVVERLPDAVAFLDEEAR